MRPKRVTNTRAHSDDRERPLHHRHRHRRRQNRIAAALVRAFVAQGHRVAVMKPVASGSDRTARRPAKRRRPGPDGSRQRSSTLRPGEPLLLRTRDFPAYRSRRRRYHRRYSPSSAATSTPSQPQQTWSSSKAPAAGWPRSARTASIKDLAKALDLPVVLVVGIRLGCINHARLTKLAIEIAPGANSQAGSQTPSTPRCRAKKKI